MNHQIQDTAAQRKELTQTQAREICKGSLIFILATDEACTHICYKFEDEEDGTIDLLLEDDAAEALQTQITFTKKVCINHTLEAACKTQTNAVSIITTAKLKKKIEAAISNASISGCDAKILTIDSKLTKSAKHNAAGYDVFNISHDLLQFMHDEACKIDSAYQNIIVLSAVQPNITAEHICELYAETKEHKRADIVTSWINFFPNLPLVFSRSLLENLDSKLHLVDKKEKSNLKLPHLNVVDHIFGGEELNPEPSTNKNVESFLEKISDENETWPPEYLGAKSKNLDLVWADNFGKRCKLDFPLLMKGKNKDSLAYLDNAATSQRCALALQAMRDFDENTNANIYRGTYELSESSTAAYGAARERIAQFIGAKEANEVIFTTNTTSAINLVAQSWCWNNLQEGDTIAISISMHHSGIVPFQIAAEKSGAKIEYIPYDDNGRIDRQAFTAIMKKHPKLVCIPHVGNMFGIIEPVAQLADEAHGCGARVLLDAAQSLPHIPLNVNDLHVDWMAFSGHKAYGPFGTGILWCSEEVCKEMGPQMGGGGTIIHVGQQNFTYREQPIQFELGTPAISQAVGLAAALEYLDTLGMKDVQRHEAILTKYLVRQLQKLDGITIIGDHSKKDGQVGLVSFTVRGTDSMDVVGFLGKLGIASRGGGHCALPLAASLGLRGTVRLSLGIYTTKRDIDVALEALRFYQKLA